MDTFNVIPTDVRSVVRQQAANLITGLRVLLLFLVGAFAVSGDRTLAYLAVPLALVTLVMDWFDGVVARRWGCQSKVGALLDIAGDRMVENVWWVIFAWLRLVPLWVPVVVLSRGFLIDTLRSYALSKGHTAFGDATMMRSKVGHFLVASRASRVVYGVAKVVAFGLLFLLHAVRNDFNPANPWLAVLVVMAFVATYLTVALCVIRGLPVLPAAGRLLREERTAT